MIDDQKFVNTVKLIALKNALEFSNTIRIDVVISKIFSISKEMGSGINIKDLVPEIKEITSELGSLPVNEKKTLYDSITLENNHYLKDLKEDTGIANNIQKDSENKKKKTSAGNDIGFELPNLEGAVKGEVITRFPPEPNGYPHIGHAKAAVIDEEYARKYGGKLILRYDDTNPQKEKIEYYSAIKDGLDWLQVKPDEIKNTSDDIVKIYEYGKELIRRNFAYVCSCSPEDIKRNRLNAIACKCTNNPNENNLSEFENMISGQYDQNQAILRYRGDMTSLNTAMRDPTLFRVIKGGYHPKVGSKYSLWPTYDFVAPIEDSLDGVTHAFRTKEYELRNELYFSILDNLSLRKPRLIEFSRLEFEGIPVSKRKITPLIEQGIIKNWDDPRLPTLMGLRRRGILPEAIRKFVLSLSITLSETKPSMEILESFNRKMLDPKAQRLFFVKNPVIVNIDGLDIDTVEIRNHPTLDMGKRKVRVGNIIYISNDDAIKLKIGDTLRLMDLCNIEILSIEKNLIKDENGENEPKIVFNAKIREMKFLIIYQRFNGCLNPTPKNIRF
ncbi:MAG: glutamate--tRNA ligase family protein [Candidatus Nitrosocosmicus sp.]|nr:glutamate--tRNA ligase family protein [Candidatus Nitrosocosmicus sp.]